MLLKPEVSFEKNKTGRADKSPLILPNESSTVFHIMCNIFFRLAAHLTQNQRSLCCTSCLLGQSYCKVTMNFLSAKVKAFLKTEMLILQLGKLTQAEEETCAR